MTPVQIGGWWPENTPPETQAAATYLLRKIGRDVPFGGTSGGRWYPHEKESCPDCSHVYQPSRTYPWTLYKHCFSLKHVAQNLQADSKEVRRIVKNPVLLIGLHPILDEYIEKELLKCTNQSPSSPRTPSADAPSTSPSEVTAPPPETVPSAATPAWATPACPHP